MDNDLIQDTNLDLLQVQVAEVEYSGIAPINVDNQEHTISLDPSALSSKLDTSAFDEWTATHSAGQEYSAGEGIDITDHVISVTGQLTGDYLTKASADTLYQPIGDYLTTADSGNFYPMEGNPSGFLTGVDLSDYYKKNETSSKEEIADALTAIDNTISGLTGEFQEKGDYYSASNPSGFITGVDLSNYYEKNETSSKEEIENAITSVENIINNLSGEYYPLTSNPSGYLTAHQSLDDYQKTADMTAYQPVGDYYSASNPSGFITGVDLSDYYKKNETSSKEEISDALTSKLDTTAFTAYTATAQGTEYSAGDNIDITNHVISGKDWTDEIENATTGKLDKTAFNSGDFYPMTGNPSGFLTEHQSLSNYYEKNETSSKEEISAAFEALSGIDDPYELSAGDGISIVNNTATKKTVISCTATAEPVDTGAFYPMTGNPSGFLTAHQSLTAYQPTADMTAYYQKNETSSKEQISAALSTAGQQLHSVEPVYISNDNDIGVMTWQLVPGENVVFTENSATLQTVISVTGVPTGGGYLPLSAKQAEVGEQVHASAIGLAQGAQVSARDYSFAQGHMVSALHIASVQGISATAYDCAMAQGYEVSARQCAFAQGAQTTADYCSLAQGGHCSAWSASIAQGEYNTASLYSQAFGDHTRADDHTMAIGAYNKTSANTPFVIGNGTSEANRSDLFIINSTGGVSAAGKISANGVELGAGGGSETTAYSALSAKTISGGVLNYTRGIIDTISTKEIKSDNGSHIIPKTKYYNVHETVIHTETNNDTIGSTANDISTNFVYNNVYDTVTGQIDTRYHNYTFGNNGEYIGYDTRIDVTLPFTATQVSFTACDTSYKPIYAGLLTSDSGKSEWTIEPTDFNKNCNVSNQSNEIAKIQIGDFGTSETKTGVITAKLINAVDEVFATQPWVLSQLTGQGAGFPITGMDGSTLYSADCNGSSFNIRSQYSTTYFAPRTLYHSHSPAYGASAEYSDIIDVANTFCTAIPCVTVANSGLATGQNILYIVTGN